MIPLITANNDKKAELHPNNIRITPEQHQSRDRITTLSGYVYLNILHIILEICGITAMHLLSRTANMNDFFFKFDLDEMIGAISVFGNNNQQ